MDRFFYIIYQFIDSKKLLSFGILCVFIFFLIFIASKIEFEEDITKLSPLLRAHINVLGRYSFSLSQEIVNGKLRELNQIVTADLESLS